MGNRAGREPGWVRGGDALHKEARPGRAIRAALEHHRALGQIWDQDGRHVRVVAEQVAFREAESGPESFPDVRQAYGSIADLDLEIIYDGVDSGILVHGP